MIRTSIEAFQINPIPPIDDTLRRPSVMLEISDLLKNPEAPVAEVLRLITIEITYLAIAMRTCTERGGPWSEMKSNMGQLKGLQQLSRHLVEKYARAKRDDLNMDGPKFQFVYREIKNCFREALKEAARNMPEKDIHIQTTMKIFDDLIASRSQDIRSKVAKIKSEDQVYQ